MSNLMGCSGVFLYGCIKFETQYPLKKISHVSSNFFLISKNSSHKESFPGKSYILKQENV